MKNFLNWFLPLVILLLAVAFFMQTCNDYYQIKESAAKDSLLAQVGREMIVLKDSLRAERYFREIEQVGRERVEKESEEKTKIYNQDRASLKQENKNLKSERTRQGIVIDNLTAQIESNCEKQQLADSLEIVRLSKEKQAQRESYDRTSESYERDITNLTNSNEKHVALIDSLLKVPEKPDSPISFGASIGPGVVFTPSGQVHGGMTGNIGLNIKIPLQLRNPFKRKR